MRDGPRISSGGWRYGWQPGMTNSDEKERSGKTNNDAAESETNVKGKKNRKTTKKRG